MTRTAVYSHYDAQGQLLYVGCSRNPTRRFWEHKCRSEWAQQVKRTEIEWHDTRASALAAEANAIAELSPSENVMAPIAADHESAAGFARIVGVVDLAKELRVTKSAVRAALTKRKFPARWGLIIATICRARGLHCRMDAFTWSGNGGDDPRCIADVMFGPEKVSA